MLFYDFNQTAKGVERCLERDENLGKLLCMRPPTSEPVATRACRGRPFMMKDGTKITKLGLKCGEI